MKAFKRSKPAPQPAFTRFYFWYVRDDYAQKFRVGRSDGPNDQWDMMTKQELEQLKTMSARFSIEVRDITDED